MSRTLIMPTLGSFLLGALAVADELELVDGGRLTGVVQSITDSNLIRAKLEIAAEPIDLRADEVVQVHFEGEPVKLTHDAILTLANGDKLPCDLTAITADSVQVMTSYAGSLMIPREVITATQLGIRPRRVLFTGPTGLKGWKVDGNWHYEEGALIADGRGSVSREMDELPESFSLAFRLDWSRKPLLKFYFASEVREPGGGDHERYYLQVNEAGLSLHRQSAGASNSHALITSDHSNDRHAEKGIHVELRYDRRKNMLHLLVDGQMEGRAIDPIELRPEGRLIVVHNEGGAGDIQKVSSLQIKEWDATRERHRSEDRGDPDKDALINHEGQRFGGRLLGSVVEPSGMLLRFKSPLAPEALQIPTSEISTLFFKEPDTLDLDLPPLTLGIGRLGLISASACTFSESEVALNHPLLGDLTLDRSAIRRLERRPSEPDQTTTPDEE